MPALSLTTGRRFVLGRQGLWPGRRWAGRPGVDQAIRYIHQVQVDPLDVVGHSHDLTLWGRVDGYRTEDLEDALYRDRTVFEYGGALEIHPVEELPYLRLVRERKVAEKRWADYPRANADLVARVLREVEGRGPLGSRDVAGGGAATVSHFRSAKEAGVALYYLFLRGDLMISSRRRGEKVFDLTRRLFPRPPREVSVADTEEHLIFGVLDDLGLPTGADWLNHAQARIGRSELRREWPARLRRWQEEGRILTVDIQGWTGSRWIPAQAAEELETLEAGGVPSAWSPVGTTTTEEVVLLAPLDMVSARGRGAKLFGFEYLWEVYKPASARRWGYYTLPILYGNDLVARVELTHDRAKSALTVVGFWPEYRALLRDAPFAEALGRALARLASFRGATDLEPTALSSRVLRGGVRAAFDAGLPTRRSAPAHRSPRHRPDRPP